MSEKTSNKCVHGMLILPRFNGHQHLTDEVSNAKIYKAEEDLAVF